MDKRAFLAVWILNIAYFGAIFFCFKLIELPPFLSWKSVAAWSAIVGFVAASISVANINKKDL